MLIPSLLRLMLAVYLVAVLVTSGPCLAAEARLLSNLPESGYATIEAIQGNYCKARPDHSPSHNCNFDAAKCRTTVEELWQKMFGEKPSEESLSQTCSQVSTKFEMPGAYRLLEGFYSEVLGAAPLVSLPKIEGIRLGSLPLREVNARVIPTKATETPIILFNIRFFEFASELAKVSALPIPMRESGGTLVIDGSKEALEQNLKSDRELLFLFINRLMHFLEIEGLKPAPPPKNIQPILVRYQEGTELFAFAHEYTHVALKHQGETALLEGIDVPAEVLGISGEKADWIQEFEADYYGAKLVQIIFEHRTKATNVHITDPLLWATPEFYFFARELIDAALSILGGEETLPGPSDQERKLFAVAESCIQTTGCDLRANLLDTKLKPVGHPHPEIRRNLVKIVLRRPSNQSETEVAMQALADKMLRNAEYLGEQVISGLRNPEMRELVNRARIERTRGSAK